MKDRPEAAERGGAPKIERKSDDGFSSQRAAGYPPALLTFHGIGTADINDLGTGAQAMQSYATFGS